MAKQSGFLQRREAELDATFNAGAAMAMQFAMDTLQMALHQTEGWGYDRIMRITHNWVAVQREYKPALDCRNPEADVRQEHMDRVLGRIEMQRNDAHHERCVKLIDEEQKHYAAYFDLLRPYEGKPIADVPPDVLEQAQAELDKARAAGQEWNRRNGIKLNGLRHHGRESRERGSEWRE